MATTPALVEPSSGRRVWRIGRRPSPTALRLPKPLWSYGPLPPITRGNRFDPPDGHNALLYVAASRDGAYTEVLHTLRTDAETAQDLAAVTRSGISSARWAPVPEQWWHDIALELTATRVVVEATIRDDMPSIALNTHQTFRYLTPRLVGVLSAAGLPPVVDNGVVMSPARALTRPIGGVLNTWRRQSATPISGITYTSRVDTAVTCEALFGAYPLERSSVTVTRVDPADIVRVGLRLSGEPQPT